MGRLPASDNQILITYLITNIWIQVCSHPDSLEKYFTKVGCGISATVKYDHLVFTQNFSSGDYLFVYADGENNVVSLIHPNPDSEDTPEAYMPVVYVVDIMVDYILESLECKNGNIFDESDYSFGEEHEMHDESYYLSGALEKSTRYKYI